MNLGAKLRRLRQQKRLSQKEVADQIGRLQSTYCSWESDASEPRLNDIVLLMHLFEVDIVEFLPTPHSVDIKNDMTTKQGIPVNNYTPPKGELFLYEEIITHLKEQLKDKERIIQIQDIQIQNKDQLIDTLQFKLANLYKDPHTKNKNSEI